MTIALGKGVKLEKAEKAISKSASELVAGEEVWFFAKCNNLRPMTDALVITNARVMGLSTGQGFKFQALFSEVVSVSYDPKGKTVDVVTSRGDRMTFKNVDPDDVPAVEHYIEHGRQQAPPPSLIVALADRAEASNAPSSQEDDERKFGRQVADGMFGLRTVRVYDKGFVRVALPLMGSKARYERLISIKASSDVTKKSGLGRGIGAAVTLGANLASPNKRGDVYLTISTDLSTHVLHEDPPTAQNLRMAKKLEGAGNAVLAARAASPASPASASHEAVPLAETTPVPRTTAQRLREIQELFDQGLVSAAEYQAQRARLLDGV